MLVIPEIEKISNLITELQDILEDVESKYISRRREGTYKLDLLIDELKDEKSRAEAQFKADAKRFNDQVRQDTENWLKHCEGM